MKLFKLRCNIFARSRLAAAGGRYLHVVFVAIGAVLLACIPIALSFRANILDLLYGSNGYWDIGPDLVWTVDNDVFTETVFVNMSRRRLGTHPGSEAVAIDNVRFPDYLEVMFLDAGLVIESAAVTPMSRTQEQFAVQVAREQSLELYWLVIQKIHIIPLGKVTLITNENGIIVGRKMPVEHVLFSSVIIFLFLMPVTIGVKKMFTCTVRNWRVSNNRCPQCGYAICDFVCCPECGEILLAQE
ncbi:MAG: hypothetical protein AAFQ71_07385 [Planctomycetota bacterium]